MQTGYGGLANWGMWGLSYAYEQTDDFAFQLVSQVGLVFFDDLRYKTQHSANTKVDV